MVSRTVIVHSSPPVMLAHTAIAGRCFVGYLTGKGKKVRPRLISSRNHGVKPFLMVSGQKRADEANQQGLTVACVSGNLR
jgi:hypothetical protein